VDAILLGAWLLSLAPPASADPLLRPGEVNHLEVIQAVNTAEHEVNHAWAVFHKAALGGTIASPAIQADVEQALHESRGLLVKAREAANRDDWEALQPLLNRIHELTARAVTESQEKKR